MKKNFGIVFFLIAFSLLLAFLDCEPPLPAVHEPTADEVYSSLSKRLKIMLTRNDLDRKAGQLGRLYAWNWGYLGRAALQMHQATGEDRFLSLVRDISENLLSLRDDALQLIDQERQSVIPSWGTLFKNGKRANEITTAGLITLPMCQYALATGDDRIGRAAVATLSAFIPERKDAFGGYFFEHLSEGYVEPLNHAHAYGAALSYCSRLDYAPESFTETALGVYRYWIHFVRADGNGISWPYMPRPDSPDDLPSEAIWKAGVTIELPIALVDIGLLERDEIIPQLTRAILENPIIEAGGIPQFIGTDQLLDITTRPDIRGKSLAGLISSFVLLDDEAVTEAFTGMMRHHPAYFPGGWLGGSRSMILSYAFLQRADADPVK